MKHLLNPEVETLIVGGLGSDRSCMQKVVGDLSQEIDDVRGFTYYEASKMGRKFWQETNKRNLILYSGSAPLAAKAIKQYQQRPDTLTFVAPPNVLTRWSAMIGFVRAARARTDIGQQDGISDSSVDMIRRFLTETSSHTPEYFKLIHNSRRFNQLASAVALQSMGIREVNLVVPRNDEMFSSYVLPMGNDEEGKVGARYIVVDGGHTRFSADPLGTLHEAERANYAMVDDEILGVAPPERLSTPPTISESLRLALHGMQRLTQDRLSHAA